MRLMGAEIEYSKERKTYYDTVTYIDNDNSFLSKRPSTCIETLDCSNCSTVKKSVYLNNNNLFNTLEKSYPKYGLCNISGVQDTLYGCEWGHCCSKGSKSLNYGVGIGLISDSRTYFSNNGSSGSTNWLVGYIRNDTLYGDSLSQTLFSIPDTTTITEPTINYVNIYPNPTINKISIEIPDSIINVDLSIYDLFGRSVYQKQMKSKTQVIDVSNWNKGVYIIIIDGLEEKYINKIIKL